MCDGVSERTCKRCERMWERMMSQGVREVKVRESVRTARYNNL